MSDTEEPVTHIEQLQLVTAIRVTQKNLSHTHTHTHRRDRHTHLSSAERQQHGCTYVCIFVLWLYGSMYVHIYVCARTAELCPGVCVKSACTSGER
jgi:hypothetical protein